MDWRCQEKIRALPAPAPPPTRSTHCPHQRRVNFRLRAGKTVDLSPSISLSLNVREYSGWPALRRLDGLPACPRHAPACHIPAAGADLPLAAAQADVDGVPPGVRSTGE